MKAIIVLFYLQGFQQPIVMQMRESEALPLLQRYATGQLEEFVINTDNTPTPWVIRASAIQAITTIPPEQLQQQAQQQPPKPGGLNPMGYLAPKSN